MYRSWSYLGAVRLLPSGLVSLGAGAAALVADCLGYSQSRAHGGGEGLVEGVQVARWVHEVAGG